MTPKLDTETLTTFGQRTTPGAREAAARLAELESLAPRSILRFYDQSLALAALLMLAAEDYDLGLLPDAMRRMAGHPDFRSRKHPPQLHDWLKKRQFLGWLEDDSVPAEPGVPAAKAATALLDVAPEGDQALWRRVRGRLEGALTEKTFGTWFGMAYLASRSGTLFLVAGSGMARDWIRDNAQRRVDAWWAEIDPAKRPLTLVSKIQFEAAAGREGVS